MTLLNAGKLGELAGLLEYDVQATPELCAAYRAAIARAPASLDLKPQRPNMEWLKTEGCDVARPRSR